MGESAPFWRFSAASYPDLEGTMSPDAVLRAAKRIRDEKSDTSTGVVYSADQLLCPISVNLYLR